MCSAKGHVRFTPESGHVRCKQECPLSAKSGHRKIFDRYSSHPKKRIRRGYIGRAGWAKASLLMFFQHSRKDEPPPPPFACLHYGSGEEQTGGSPRIDCSVRVYGHVRFTPNTGHFAQPSLGMRTQYNIGIKLSRDLDHQTSEKNFRNVISSYTGMVPALAYCKPRGLPRGRLSLAVVIS